MPSKEPLAIGSLRNSACEVLPKKRMLLWAVLTVKKTSIASWEWTK